MENISVCVRLRALSKLEERERCVWKVDGRCVVHVDGDLRRDADSRRDNDARRSGTYTADHVFGPECDNERVYQEAVEGLVHDAVEGKNVTIMVYGQTGSGKTHTMGTPEAPGIIQRALVDIFDLISQKEDRDYLLRFSYLEIYNENVTDLLSPEKVPKPLLIKEDRVVGPVVLGLSEELVTSPEDVLRLLHQGEAKRHVAASKMNERSNRSHAVSRMVLESRPAGCEHSSSTPVIVSNLVLVDLAGSESVAKTGAEGERLKESSCINKSLLALGEVVFKLSEGALAAGAHIPYRDSKLTRILKPSLGGNAKTMIICTINPAGRHTEESHRTLRFACRAKRVVNTVVVNEVAAATAAARWQAKALKELQRRRAEGTVASSEDVRAQIKALRTELLWSEEQRAKAAREAEVARQLMVHTFDMAAAAAAAAAAGTAGTAETPTRPHSHSCVRTRSWSPSAPPGGALTMEAAAAAWASPGLAPALAARTAAAPPPLFAASEGSISEGRDSREEDMASLLCSLSLAFNNNGGGGGGGGGGGLETAVSDRRSLEDGDVTPHAAPAAAAAALPPQPPPSQQIGSASRRGKRPSTSPTHFPSPTRLQEAVELWRIENGRLRQENSQLREELQPKLKQELQWLTATIATHEALNAQLQAERDAALQLVDGLQEENAELQRALADLHRQLQLQTARSTTGSHNTANLTAITAVPVPTTAAAVSAAAAPVAGAAADVGEKAAIPYTLEEAAAALAGEALTLATAEELEEVLAVTSRRAEELESLVLHMQRELEVAHAVVEEARAQAAEAVCEARERVAHGDAEAEELRAQLAAVLDEVEVMRGRLQVYDLSSAYRMGPMRLDATFDLERGDLPHPRGSTAANIEALTSAWEAQEAALAQGASMADDGGAGAALAGGKITFVDRDVRGFGQLGEACGVHDTVRLGDTDTLFSGGQVAQEDDDGGKFGHSMLSPYPYIYPVAFAHPAAARDPHADPVSEPQQRVSGLKPSWKLQSVPELSVMQELDGAAGMEPYGNHEQEQQKDLHTPLEMASDLDDFEPALEPVDVLQELCMQYAAAAAAAAAAADPSLTDHDLRASAEEAQATVAMAAAAARQRVSEELQAVRASAAAAVAAATAAISDELADAQEVAIQQDALIADLQAQLVAAVAEADALRQQLLQQQQAQGQGGAQSTREPELTAALEAALEAAEVALLKAEARAAALADERDALRERLQKLLAAGAAAAAAATASASTPGEGEDDDEEEEGAMARRPALTPSPWPEEWKTPREEPWDTHTIWGFPGADDTWRSADVAKCTTAVATVSMRDAEVAQLRGEVAALQQDLSRALEERMAAEAQAGQLRTALDECQKRLRSAVSENTALQAEAQQRATELSSTRRAAEEREAKLAALRATLLVCELPSKQLPFSGSGSGTGSGASTVTHTAAGAGAPAPSQKPKGCPSANAPTAQVPAAAEVSPVPAPPPAVAAAGAGSAGTKGRNIPTANSGVRAVRAAGPGRAQGAGSGGGSSGGGGGGSGGGVGGGIVSHRRLGVVRGPAELLRRSRVASRGGPAAAAAGAGNGSLMAVAAAAAKRRYAADSYDGAGTEEEATPPVARRLMHVLGRRVPSVKGRVHSSSLVSELFERLDRLERLHQNPPAVPPQPPAQQQQAQPAARRRVRSGFGTAAAQAFRRGCRKQLLDVKAHISTSGYNLQLLAPGVEKVDAAMSYPPGEGMDPATASNATTATAAPGVCQTSFPSMSAQLTITLRGA